MKRRTVCRLMNGTEKRYSDCYAHALFLREKPPATVVVLADGTILYWPSYWVVDDATAEEKADFYMELNETRRKNRKEIA